MEKTLHFIWYQGLRTAPPELQAIPSQWKSLNPEYQIKVWDSVSLEEFIKNCYPHYLSFFRNIGSGQTERQAVIKKCDFGRLLALLRFGGGYIDLDCEPVKPLRSLFDYGKVEHIHTRFVYSRNGSYPTNLKKIHGKPIQVDFEKYELILSREHCFNTVLNGWSVSNTVMFAKAGSALLNDMIVSCIANVKEKVLAFAGPLGLSKYLISRISDLSGRVLTLPPYYFLWQKHDMGEVWERAVCCHQNRMDWTDKTNIVPWDC
ncbi:MAG: glycosyltransferase [Chitinophagaceae bacterium]